MKLRTKFVIAIGTILVFSFATILLFVARLQHRLILTQAKQQARMLTQQIMLTRQWIADHQGLFIVMTNKDRPNPFLDHAVLRTEDGTVFVKRNPAMVTRELSEYASRSGFCWFRVTSLRPINPANEPDEFEKRSLQLFEKGAREHYEIIQGEQGKILRYISALTVRQGCLNCHARHGYRLGDIRGGLSISIPITWADQTIARNNRSILYFGLVSVSLVVLVLCVLFHHLVSKPLGELAQAMDAYPKQRDLHLPGAAGDDEIARLSQRFLSLCQRLEESQQALHMAQEKAFRNEKLAALGQLTAGIAHEINNPLGGMRNCVKTMLADPEDRELHRRYLQLLDKGLHRIEQTMRKLLNFGRVEPLRLSRTDVDEVIRECFELLSYRLKNIELELDLRLDDQTVCLDIEAIKQIVMNIGLNAIQAMPDGGRLRVSTRSNGKVLTMRFEDTGCGIPPEIRDKIFDPFFTTKDVGEGTGLGLAVCHRLVEQMQGTIEVRSATGQGSVFTVTLPVNTSCLR